MSILLDALRKSEQRQRSGEVPGLSTPAPGDPPRAGGAMRRLWIVLAIPLLVLGSAAAWHYWAEPDAVVTQRTQESQAPESPAAGKQAAGGPATKGKPGGSGGGKEATPRSPVESLAAAESSSKPADGQGRPAPPKTAAQDGAKSKGAAERQGVVKAGGEARKQAAQPGAKIQGAGTDQQAGKVARAGKAPGKKPGKAAGTAAGKDPKKDSAAPATQLSGTGKAVQKKPAQKKPAQKKPKPEVIGYWELPPKARNQLPEMRITVLVYAERPEDRFLLMNGTRYGEGDKIADELVLQEIRREGAVMKFRLYRFLVTQG